MNTEFWNKQLIKSQKTKTSTLRSSWSDLNIFLLIDEKFLERSESQLIIQKSYNWEMEHKYFTYIDKSSKIHRINEERINKKIIWIQNQKWRLNKMNFICLLISDWKAEKIMAYSNYQPHILKSIKQINFPYLWKISLVNNRISSIESLHRLKMPVLADLSINENGITCLKDLRKSSWTNLKRLNISDTPVNEGGTLSEMGTKVLSNLFIQYSTSDGTICFDTHWIAKLNTKQLNVLKILSGKRLQQNNFMNKMQAKFKTIRIYTAVQMFQESEEEDNEPEGERYYETRRGRRGRGGRGMRWPMTEEDFQREQHRKNYLNWRMNAKEENYRSMRGMGRGRRERRERQQYRY